MNVQLIIISNKVRKKEMQYKSVIRFICGGSVLGLLIVKLCQRSNSLFSLQLFFLNSAISNILVISSFCLFVIRKPLSNLSDKSTSFCNCACNLNSVIEFSRMLVIVFDCVNGKLEIILAAV